MAIVADRVRETTTTTGTGALTLAGATTGCRTFNSALGVGVACFYTLLDANGTGWECGIGQLSSSTSFTRTTVQKSSNANAAITLSTGTHTIFCSLSEGWAKWNVDSSGQVGLGTAPGAPFDVYGTYSLFRNADFQLYMGNGTLASGGSAASPTLRSDTGPIVLSFSTTERFRFDNAGQFILQTVGKGLSIKEGSNAKMGTATLVAGTVVVSTTAVTANSRIFLTAQSLSIGLAGIPQALAVSARTAGTSFTISSASASDASVIGWIIYEPS